jgi:hypothetical protein
MSFKSILGASITIGMLVASTAAVAGTGGLRCGTRLVSLGDTQYDVQALCGPPDARQQRTEIRTVRHPVRVACSTERGGWCTTYAERSIEVAIEEWLYDFGPRRFVQHLLFEQGRLVDVESGERGYKTL